MHIVNAVLALTLLASPASLFAETTVENVIFSSAESSGNTAREGEVIEGEATHSVFVETVVDGETVEYIDLPNATGTVSSEYENGNIHVSTEISASEKPVSLIEIINVTISRIVKEEEGAIAEEAATTSVDDIDAEKPRRNVIAVFISRIVAYVRTLFTF